MAKLEELLKEWKDLVTERIGYARAGADGSAFTAQMRERDIYTNDRIKDVEAELFPLLTNRKTLTFDKTPRPKMWEESDKLYFSGWILVNSSVQCDQVRCETVTGTKTYAKDPTWRQ